MLSLFRDKNVNDNDDDDSINSSRRRQRQQPQHFYPSERDCLLVGTTDFPRPPPPQQQEQQQGNHPHNLHNINSAQQQELDDDTDHHDDSTVYFSGEEEQDTLTAATSSERNGQQQNNNNNKNKQPRNHPQRRNETEERDDTRKTLGSPELRLSRPSSPRRRRRRRSSLSSGDIVSGGVEDYSWMEPFHDAVTEIRHALQEEIQQVQEIWVNELQQVDPQQQQTGDDNDDEHKHDKYSSSFMFLDMGLARSLSILPRDVVDAAVGTTTVTVLPSSSSSPLSSLQPSPQQPQQQTTEKSQQFSWPLQYILDSLPDYWMFSAQQPPHTTADGAPEEACRPANGGETKERQPSPVVVPASPVGRPTPSSRPSCLAWVMLFLAVLSISASGPLMKVQQNVESPMLQVAWRTSATAILLFPLAYYAIRKEGYPVLSWSQWVMVLVAAFSATILLLGFFVLSLHYTTVGNALILSNSQSMLLLMGKFCVDCHRVTTLEALGAVVAFTGTVLCSIDSSVSSSSSWWGDLYGLLSGIGGVGYLVFAKSVRPHLNLFVFLFLNMFFGSLYAFLLVYWMGSPITLDFDLHHGMFGWMNYWQSSSQSPPPNYDRLPLEVVMVLVCNLFGALGYVRAMRYFDNWVISVAALTEPVVAELLAFLLGVGFLPGWKGWCGYTMVLCGTLAVVYKPSKRGRGKGGKR